MEEGGLRWDLHQGAVSYKTTENHMQKASGPSLEETGVRGMRLRVDKRIGAICGRCRIA
jgi:hypothetical protein